MQPFALSAGNVLLPMSARPHKLDLGDDAAVDTVPEAILCGAQLEPHWPSDGGKFWSRGLTSNRVCDAIPGAQCAGGIAEATCKAFPAICNGRYPMPGCPTLAPNTLS
eukprot:CAMPEP_0180683266 /NCGR_PEP_ID=MMETSP1037_2-20121125/71042_1 /TAXON_ID=632150 /ORGANISM="Azadinium spinosum, Strain 3D9" /LENGTH=107 /DNA_ID=CAMNT_0022713401 /DNA_START=1757 /DNA_END=2077 /DNA_ORIENTATION=+